MNAALIAFQIDLGVANDHALPLALVDPPGAHGRILHVQVLAPEGPQEHRVPVPHLGLGRRRADELFQRVLFFLHLASSTRRTAAAIARPPARQPWQRRPQGALREALPPIPFDAGGVFPRPKKPTVRSLFVSSPLCGAEKPPRALVAERPELRHAAKGEAPLADDHREAAKRGGAPLDLAQVLGERQGVPIVAEAMVGVQVETHVVVAALRDRVPQLRHALQRPLEGGQHHRDPVGGHAGVADHTHGAIIEVDELG
mmetsp:Transcript_41338/g.124776  ORF Transcript_41338/g.124776 Transcript_41338/m.124776 type:complete len:257 (-) Transcript_41338:639-1409(-)